jgi:hypothetical protein
VAVSAIKDIVDLCIKLRNENPDSKIVAALSEIQDLTLKLQSEQDALADKNEELNRKITNLETAHKDAIEELRAKHAVEISKLKGNTASPATDKLDETTEKILRYIFDQRSDLTAPHIAEAFGLKQDVADSHLGALAERKYIVWHSIAFGGSSHPEFMITTKGQGYIVKSRLAD